MRVRAPQVSTWDIFKGYEQAYQKQIRRYPLPAVSNLTLSLDPDGREAKVFLQKLVVGLRRKSLEHIDLSTMDEVVRTVLSQKNHLASLPMYNSDKPNFGIFYGSLNPPHLVHFITLLAALVKEKLDGIVICPSGVILNKPFALSFALRQQLISGVVGQYPDLYVSTLREDMRKVLGNEEDNDFARFSRIVNIFALRYLMAANPHVNWSFYIVGTDKLKDFHARKNTELTSSLQKQGTKLLVFERGDEVPLLDRELLGGAVIDNFFIGDHGGISSSRISSSTARMIIAKGNDPQQLEKFLHPLTIQTILSSPYILEAFTLEYSWQKMLRTSHHDPQAIKRMNEERQELFERGILQNGDPLLRSLLLSYR